jgi:uncharacterized protein (TIGR02246 family)
MVVYSGNASALVMPSTLGPRATGTIQGMVLVNSAQEPDLAADELAIRNVEAGYDTAWNRGDALGAARFFTEDAVVINPSGGSSAGREAIERSLSDLLEGRGRGSTHRSEIVSIHFLKDDVALLDGEAVIVGFGDESATLRHRFTDVLVRVGGGWRIAQVRAYVFLPPLEEQNVGTGGA